VADGSGGDEVRQLIENGRWSSLALRVSRLAISPPNAVRQREAAIAASTGDLLLLLDDDVELEPECLAVLKSTLAQHPDAVAAMADFNNQSWPNPTRAWRWYMVHVLGMAEQSWQGRVVGPLLRFGYNPSPVTMQPMEWLGTGNSLVRRASFAQAGGFSSFFLHRCSMNEDVDLGLRLRRVGRIYLCPTARLAHYQDPGGRVPPRQVAEDDMFNRYMILRHTLNRSRTSAMVQIGLFVLIESLSALRGVFIFRNRGVDLRILRGRVAGLVLAAKADKG
jgi:GT2 family glycosyltransferase